MSDSIERAERYLAMRRAEIRQHINTFRGYATGGGLQPHDIISDLLAELKTERAKDLKWFGGSGFNIVRSDTVVQTFDDGDVKITIYEATYKTGTVFVAADQSGWLDGSWATTEEALQAALQTNGLT